jgi:hypothetical protein
VINGCEQCDQKIRGVEIDPEVLIIGGDAAPPPRFCDGCGAPFPWVDRQGRIYELQNLLEREQLDAATELFVREQLDALANPDLPEASSASGGRGFETGRPDC